MFDLMQQAQNTREASYTLAQMSITKRNALLLAMADNLDAHEKEIFAINEKNVLKVKAEGLSSALVDRLTLTPSRFLEMVEGVRKVAALADPIGKISDGRTLENGLHLYKRTVPLGVVGVIYESRPNVTVDIAALCLKSANACLLRGGKECFETNLYLSSLIADSLFQMGFDKNCVGFIADTSRQVVSDFLKLDDYIDVIIPRGGEALQRRCQRESSIPVIIGGFGVSHIFVDDSCALDKSLPLIENAKTQKPSACNALDTLLVHEGVKKEFLEKFLEYFLDSGILVHAHGEAYDLLQGYPHLVKGQSADFDREFLAKEMNVALVADVRAALSHMQAHHAIHSDAILTDSHEHAQLFVTRAPSACVYVNASTRFSDGGQFGLGAEVAISTQKLHARGPMALEALTTYQYVAMGSYLSRR